MLLHRGIDLRRCERCDFFVQLILPGESPIYEKKTKERAGDIPIGPAVTLPVEKPALFRLVNFFSCEAFGHDFVYLFFERRLKFLDILRCVDSVPAKRPNLLEGAEVIRDGA